MEPKSAEEFQAELDRIAKASDADPTNGDLVAEYEAMEAKAATFKASRSVQKRHKQYNAPSVNLTPPSVIQGSRDDGRYTLDQFLRGDPVAARELASYGDVGKLPGRAGELGARMLSMSPDASEHAEMVAKYAQTETTTGGGYLVPTITAPILVKIKKAFGGISAHAFHINTGNGAPLNFPSIDDTANSAAVTAINVAASAGGADLAFTQVALGAFKIAATGTGNAGLKVPRELIDDAMFDVTALVTEMLGIRLARKAAALYAQGVGTTEPSGLFNATAPITAPAGGLVQATANAQLQTFIHSLDPAYINDNCCWIMNWGTHGTLSGFVDTTTRPLMQSYADSGLAEPMTYRLLGFPVYIDQGAPAFSLTASANPAAVNTSFAAFGDINEAFVIRDVQGIGIAVDPYTGIGANQVLFYGYMRTDSVIKNRSAVVLLPGYHA